MLTALRRAASTWVAKILFVLLIFSFAIWGVGDVVRGAGRDNVVARVGGLPIEAPELQEAYRREVSRVQRMLQGRLEITPDMRQLIANQALEQLIQGRVVEVEARARGLAAGEDALRAAIREIQIFRGLDGRFSRLAYEGFLRQNGLSEARFLELLAADLKQRQLGQAVRAGAVAPVSLIREIHRFENERRVLDSVSLPFAAAPEPEAPTEAALRRFHENNADRFSTPEFRRIEVAILTPEALMNEVEVSDAEIEQAYEARRGTYVRPVRRTIQLVSIADMEKAEEIAGRWREGAEWSAIEAAATEAGGNAMELAEQARDQLPLEELREPVFGAEEGAILGPIATALGPQVVRLVTIHPAVERPLSEVRDEVRAEAAREKAIDLSYARANRVEDALAGGASVAEVARDFGLRTVLATVDRAGNDPEGRPVPIPGAPELRTAILTAAFATRPDRPVELAEAGTATYHATAVAEIVAPALKPFESVEAEVRAAWVADTRRRAQEEKAAALLAAVRDGKSFAEAAREAGVEVRRVAPINRRATPEGIPRSVVETAFTQRVGEVTMGETDRAFVVTALAEIQPADPDADLEGFARLRERLAGTIGDELERQFGAALRDRANPEINRRLVEQVAGP